MKKFFGVALIGFLIFSACNDEDNDPRNIKIRLTDAPGDYEAVYIELQNIEVHTDEGGWEGLNTNAGVYDLLELTNGIDTVIVDEQPVSGNVSQIRLILGDQNSVVIDGEEHNLTVPSGSQSGLKLNIHETFFDGITYDILLDFDAGRSIVKAGESGKYILKPVIRTIAEAQDGAIEGVILPEGLKPAVMAINDGDTIGTYANEDGSYRIMAVPEGIYDIIIDPDDSYQEMELEDIEVNTGKVTVLETVTLEQ